MRRFFIGDVYGRMSLLTLNDAPELILIPLGEVRVVIHRDVQSLITIPPDVSTDHIILPDVPNTLSRLTQW